MRSLFITLLLFTYILANAQGADRGMKAATTPTQDVRVALVIGNGVYTDSPLRNPPNDATAMAAELRACGFSVTLLTNATLRQMQEATVAFGKQIQGNQGVGLFYFAGHGMQVSGENYLVPIGAKITVEGDVQYEAMNLGRLLAQMEAAQNKLNIVVLDACRNNPYARSFRSAGQGLAQTNAPTGSFIAYATAPGSVAADGSGSNGLYTQELLKALRTSGLSLEQIFKQVRANVVQQSAKAQVPWENSSVVGDFFFRPSGAIMTSALPTPDAAATIPPGNVTVIQGADQEEKQLKMVGFNGNNHTEALVKAIKKNNLQVATILVGRGMDLDQPDANGNVPLVEAVTTGSLSLVKLLCENGASVNVLSKSTDERFAKNNYQGYKESPLFVACRSLNDSIALYLLQKSADPNLGTKFIFKVSGASQLAVSNNTLFAALMSPLYISGKNQLLTKADYQKFYGDDPLLLQKNRTIVSALLKTRISVESYASYDGNSERSMAMLQRDFKLYATLYPAEFKELYELVFSKK